MEKYFDRLEPRPDLLRSKEHTADLDRTFISLVERGERQPTIRVVFKLAAAVVTTKSHLKILTEKLVEAD